MPKFYNRNGTITAYSFACGYGEVYGDWLGGNGVRLFSLSGGGYEVKGTVQDDTVRIWETFQYVKDARKFARQYGTYNVPEDAFTRDLPNLVTIEHEPYTDEERAYLRSVQRAAIDRRTSLYAWKDADGKYVSGLAHAVPHTVAHYHAFLEDGRHVPLVHLPQRQTDAERHAL